MIFVRSISIILLVIFITFTISKNSRADYNLGMRYYQQGDYFSAYNQWVASAPYGDANSMYGLCLLFYHGLGVPQDYNQAFYYCYNSAMRGHKQGQLQLSSMYSLGHGVPVNQMEAQKWYNLATNQPVAPIMPIPTLPEPNPYIPDGYDAGHTWD